MKLRFINMLMAILCAAILLIGGAAYLFADQRDSSNSQQLTRIPSPSFEGILDGGFQDTFEQGMKDQFSLHDASIQVSKGARSDIAGFYNTIQNTLNLRPADAGLKPFGAVYRLDGTSWLSSMPYTENASWIAGYQRKAEEINEFAARYPDVKFYAYYCSRAEDLSWYDDIEGVKSYDYAALLKSLLSENIRFGRLMHYDLADYCRKMYKTDHHWNDVGCVEGYTDLLVLLGRDFPVGMARSVQQKLDFDGLKWVGSRYRESGLQITGEGMDDFIVNRFDLPPFRTYFGEHEMSIGLGEDYAAGNVNRDVGFDQYLNYFGFESKVIRLEFDSSPTGENLLIVGDSFARALREPLSSHFDTTVYVNFRILGETDLDAIMNEYGIAAVIFMGQQDAWSGYFFNGEGVSESGDEQ